MRKFIDTIIKRGREIFDQRSLTVPRPIRPSRVVIKSDGRRIEARLIKRHIHKNIHKRNN